LLCQCAERRRKRLSRRCASRGALCADSNFLKCTGICTKHCDRRHGAGFPDERHSICQHGSGARKKALFEPGDTRRQWKGEAAACFVHTGIASSRTLPTSSVGYWSPLLSLCNASASEEKRSFGGDFFALSHRLQISPTKSYELQQERSILISEVCEEAYRWLRLYGVVGHYGRG
jgi:hypothetical protein